MHMMQYIYIIVLYIKMCTHKAKYEALCQASRIFLPHGFYWSEKIRYSKSTNTTQSNGTDFYNCMHCEDYQICDTLRMELQDLTNISEIQKLTYVFIAWQKAIFIFFKNLLFCLNFWILVAQHVINVVYIMVELDQSFASCNLIEKFILQYLDVSLCFI